MLLLIVSFIGGLLTVLAPCVLPLLPVIVGGSLSEGVNKKKALTVILSLGISVMAFTLLLKVSTLFVTVPQYVWTLVSGGIILALGIVTLFPSLWENKFIAKLSIKSNKLLGKGDAQNSFWGDVLVGVSLGPVFTTCSPTYFIVLATVLPVSPLVGIIYLLSYTIGLCIALFLVAFIGQKIVGKLGIASNPDGTFKKVLGLLFLVVGVFILTGFDKKIENKITSLGFFDTTKIEQALLNSQMKDTGIATETGKYLTIQEKDAKYKKVSELVGVDGYINTDGKKLTLEDLKGKVVLLDIWTYSCINCQRTIPYINEWYSKYKDQGFEVVGIHTPEFSFEKDQTNVEKAVKGFGIQYPVVLDNEYATWRSLGNQYWPRKYLIDMDGYIIYDHIGEGNYEETEKIIQYALKERAARLGIAENISSTTTLPADAVQVSGDVDSPETYFGAARNQYLANGTVGAEGAQTFTLPAKIQKNQLYLDGAWNIVPEYAENTGAANVVFNYDAKNIYMAAGSDQGVEVEIYKDNVFLKKIMIKDEKLYPLIEGDSYGAHTIEIKIPKAGLKAFTFTFG